MKRLLLIITISLSLALPGISQRIDRKVTASSPVERVSKVRKGGDMVKVDTKGGKSKEEKWKEFLEFKIKYVAQEIDLKADQQKQFVDLYTEKSEAKRKVFRETRSLEKRLRNQKNPSEKEYEAVSKALTLAKEKDARIDKDYDAKFATFLTQRQIFKMKEAEETFGKKIQEMWRNKQKK